MKITLKARLVRWLQNNPGFHASGSLQRLVADKTDYTPRTVVRRLEELIQEGVLEVDYRKGHSWYQIAPQRHLDPIEGKITGDLPATLQVMEEYYEKI